MGVLVPVIHMNILAVLFMWLEQLCIIDNVTFVTLYREFCKILIVLAMTEPGENWIDETYRYVVLAIYINSVLAGL